MTLRDFTRIGVLAAVSVVGACANTPAPPAQAETPSVPAETPAPVSDSVSRADALLAEMRHREAEFAKIERELPTAPAVSIEQWERARAATPAAPAPTTSAVTQPAQPAAAAPSTPARDEFYWKDRMRALQSRLDSDTMALTAARAQVDDLTRYVQPDGSMTRTVADNMFKARDNVTRLIATVVSDEREIANLQEEARRAGVPPGWLRP